MTGALYEEWLKWFDRRMRGRKVLLFVDNAPSHLSVTLRNVTVKYFPANTTALSQPMDQGVIQAFKLKYRKRQLQHVINQMDLSQGKTGTDLLKEISILDAIYWISGSWNEVECSTITKCFSNCGFQSASTDTSSGDNDDDNDADNYPLALQSLTRQLFDCDFQELINIDKEMVTCSDETQNWERPATDLLREIRGEAESGDDDEEESDPVTAPAVCSINDCLQYVQKIKAFASHHGKGAILQSSMHLNDLLNEMKMENTSKQSKISDFFTNI